MRNDAVCIFLRHQQTHTCPRQKECMYAECPEGFQAKSAIFLRTMRNNVPNMLVRPIIEVVQDFLFVKDGDAIGVIVDADSLQHKV